MTTIIDGAQPLLDDIAARARTSGLTVAVAESLTAGLLATQLGAAEEASTWFAGGVVSYLDEVKFTVLGVDHGPVITARCAEQMADGVARLTGADVAVSVTGVGGPGAQEGRPAGTVFVGGHLRGTARHEEHHLPGDPEDVLTGTVLRALEMLRRLLDEA